MRQEPGERERVAVLEAVGKKKCFEEEGVFSLLISVAGGSLLREGRQREA